MRLCCINGSPAGNGGNTHRILEKFRELLPPAVTADVVTLAESPNLETTLEQIRLSKGVLFGTGTYWDSWGSPLQRFLEAVTSSEGGDVWLGKPCAVIVAMHAVGGKGVLSRLQGVLNTYGALIPPMSGAVLSLANEALLSHEDSVRTADLWRMSDLGIVCHNLLEAISGNCNWRVWPVDRESVREVWVA